METRSEKDQLLREFVIRLATRGLPEPLRIRIVAGTRTATTYRECNDWLAAIINDIIAIAVDKRVQRYEQDCIEAGGREKLDYRYRLELECPLCDEYSCHEPGGLRSHISNHGRSIPCVVGRVLCDLNRKVELFEKEHQEQTKKDEERLAGYVIGPYNKKLDRISFYCREAEDIPAAEARLAKLGFIKGQNAAGQTYLRTIRELTLYGDPRPRTTIEIFVYSGSRSIGAIEITNTTKDENLRSILDRKITALLG